MAAAAVEAAVDVEDVVAVEVAVDVVDVEDEQLSERWSGFRFGFLEHTALRESPMLTAQITFVSPLSTKMMDAVVPPALVTTEQLNANSGSGVCCNTPKQNTLSKRFRGNGMCSMSACANRRFGCSPLISALTSMALLRSIAVTSAPVDRACEVKRPEPQPTSRIVSPSRSRGHFVSLKNRSSDTGTPLNWSC